MSGVTKIMAAVLMVAALFSGNTRKLLSLASNALVSDALASPHGGRGGASCD